ncbi:MAG: 1-acyl-sn-glycerol-3-phosphate acyltransferase [Candidatus Planktophila sp.]|jgi:1-acyl-sn-glycerol-3-phosphate acyltransferase|nr:1-acyl-sn-glycerol-3-phosphate acyltransferase [Candidatus Planktophila sp.]
MREYKITYAPPSGKPLGTNFAFKLGTKVVIPLLNLVGRKNWRGGEQIPKTGAAIVACNHVSYLDVLFLTHFLFRSGRAPRYIGKEGVFKTPIIGKIVLAAGMIPIARESADAAKALEHATRTLQAGNLLGVYPEGTLTRDPQGWPMVAKTGLVRLAIMTKVPVIPIAQWGSQDVMPTYERKIKIFPRTRINILAGPALDLSPWYAREGDPQALIEATAFVMRAITDLLEELRGQKRPEEIFDPHFSTLPRTGNFKKKR